MPGHIAVASPASDTNPTLPTAAELVRAFCDRPAPPRDADRDRFNEWAEAYRKDSSDFRSALHHILIVSMEQRVEQHIGRPFNQSEWLWPLLKAGRVIRERGWDDLLVPRPSASKSDLFALSLLRDAARGPGGEELGRVLAEASGSEFFQVEFSFYDTFIALKDAPEKRFHQEAHRLFPDMVPARPPGERPKVGLPCGAVGSKGPSDGRGKAAARKGKGKNINAQMYAALLEDPERRHWTAQEWADHLGCTKSTAAATDTWKMLVRVRAMERKERAERHGTP